MRTEDGKGAYSDNNSDTESISSDRTAFSGPLGSAIHNNKRGSKKSARFNLSPEIINGSNPGASSSNPAADDDNYVEITLDIRDDSVAVHSVHHAGGGGALHEDPELSLLAKKTLENKSSSVRSSLFRNTSSHLRQVSQELKRLASFTKRSSRRFDRTKSAAAHALKGLKFITAKTGASGNGWPAVEKRFNDLTASTDGMLQSSMFGECIGNIILLLVSEKLIFLW